MKRIPARPRFAKLSSFTLVELLVVIAIIAILAAPKAWAAIRNKTQVNPSSLLATADLRMRYGAEYLGLVGEAPAPSSIATGPSVLASKRSHPLVERRSGLRM